VKYQTAGKLIRVPRRLITRTYSEWVSVWSVIASSIIMRRMWGPFRIFYVGIRTPQTGLAQATAAKHLAALRSRQHRAVDSVFTLCSHSLMRHVEDG
jgi:hypothetical protein